MFYIYVIQNSAGKIYIGQTENIELRLKRHNGELKNKTTSYTKKQGGSWKVVYKEEILTRHEAILRERYLKSHIGRDWLKSLLRVGSSTVEQ